RSTMNDACASGTTASAPTRTRAATPSFTRLRLASARRRCHPPDRGRYVRSVFRLRFAPSPTGSLHLGGALSAVANRRFADENGGTLLLRIDDTDPTRNVPGGAEAIAA